MANHRRMKKLAAVTSVGVATLMVLTACGGAGGSSSANKSGSSGNDKVVNVLMVNNPQMTDLQKLTEDNFTKKTGIKVNYTVLPENDLRAKVSSEFSAQAGQYDVATISNYEVPFYAKNGWLESLNDSVAKDPAFDQADIIKPIQDALSADGNIYATPFYGESSFMMYRTDVFKKLGLTMPEHPTWQQIADLAAKTDGAQPGMKGICLRGQPGWGEVFAPLTTVVNTFGGTWWDKDWNAQLNTDGFLKATQFYVDLIKAHGEPGAAQAGFTECLNDFQQGKTAMWYDATSAAGSVEADSSPVKGKVGYVFAPVDKTKASGWLYSWAFGIEKAAPHKTAAEKFIEWAGSKEYIDLVGNQLGWAQVPPGTRESTYKNPDYQKAASAFYQQTIDAIDSVDPANPGVQPRPAAGIQFVAIPEFADVGTKVSQYVSDAIAGKMTVKQALDKGQPIAQQAGDAHKGK